MLILKYAPQTTTKWNELKIIGHAQNFFKYLQQSFKCLNYCSWIIGETKRYFILHTLELVNSYKH